jgi:RNA polymerase sigma-70 factor, ECF subfamily
MDKKAFPAFYDANVKRIYRFIYFRVGGRHEVAEDLTQDVFVKAFEAFDRYDPAMSASAWIYTIARNHVINQAQKNRPHVDLEEIENTLWDADNWPERMALRHDEERLWGALRSLPKEEMALIRMKYLEGWNYEDIAEIQQKTAGALRIQAHRALKKLQKTLKQK